MPRRWMTRKTVAHYLDMHVTTVDRLARSGKLTRHSLGDGAVRYDVHEVDALVISGAEQITPGTEQTGP